MKGGSVMPMNVEGKLRELASICAAYPAAVQWPAWLAQGRTTQEGLAVFFNEAADELEARSRLAGQYLRRLSGD